MPQKTLLKRALVSLIIGIVLAVTSFVWMRSHRGPLNERVSTQLKVLNRSAVASADPNTPPAELVAEIALDYPVRMKMSETLPVKAMLYPKSSEFQLSTPTDATLESPSFKITDATPRPAVQDFRHLDRLEWNWLIRPEAPGNHLIRFRVVPHGGNSVSLETTQPAVVRLDMNSAIAHVEVLTEIGWSAWWASLTPTLIGIISILVGILTLLVGVFSSPWLGKVWRHMFPGNTTSPGP